jgi:hypothetical protein
MGHLSMGNGLPPMFPIYLRSVIPFASVRRHFSLRFVVPIKCTLLGNYLDHNNLLHGILHCKGDLSHLLPCLPSTIPTIVQLICRQIGEILNVPGQQQAKALHQQLCSRFSCIVCSGFQV